MDEQTVTLETSHDILGFCRRSGRLVSCRSKAAPDQEFIAVKENDPVFVIQYLDDERHYRQVASYEAQEIEISREVVGDGRVVLRGAFTSLAGLDLDATVTVEASKDERFSRWSIALRNSADLLITDVQFPFVTLPYTLAGAAGGEALLWPYGAGRLLHSPQPHELQPDSAHAWQMIPENGTHGHYPGWTVAQFLAYYNDRAGIYLACEDTEGRVKLIKPVHRGPGLRLGVAHWGDWPEAGERELEYDVVLGSFSGDWYAAADLYREWSLKQHWAEKPLHKREDVPGWLLDSPPHIILRIQGELDFGPAEPNEAFLPYRKMVPKLEAIAERVAAPLVGVIMSWERPGPWIYPDCFPPAGGEESLREFTGLMRERGWQVGTFCNGTRWVVGHYWSGYDGEEYFEANEGAKTVCRTHDGALWFNPSVWRPDYPGCLGVSRTYGIAADFVSHVVDMGLDWIQFLDQNIGCSTFPCFATDHDHPSVPGHWMTEKMQRLVDFFGDLNEKVQQDTGGERALAFSVEGPVNEYFMPHFQVCDIRVLPPGHRFAEHPYWRDFVPLYHYLYHEFILIEGGFGQGPEPYHMPIRNAYNLVVGEIPGGVMRGDGELLNLDTLNWAPWDVEVGDNDDSLAMLATTTALRRGPAKNFLVFGRMMPPAEVVGIETVRWQYGGRDHEMPAVFHSAWQAPDGRHGVVLANWTTALRKVVVSDARLGGCVDECLSAEALTCREREADGDGLAVSLPPLSGALLASQI